MIRRGAWVLGVGVVAVLCAASRPRADAPPGRYAILDCEGTACVKDNRTGLVWKRAEEPSKLDAAGAKAACVGSWRLPTIRELTTLLDENKTAAPAIDESAFPGATVEWLWSSTVSARSAGSVFGLTFFYGNTFVIDKATLGNVRCVR